MTFRPFFPRLLVLAALFAAPLAAPHSLQAQAATIVQQPQDQQVTAGDTATLTVRARVRDLTSTQTASLTYQWFRGASGDLTRPIDNATATNFTTEAILGPKRYWVQVTSSVVTTTSSSVTNVISVTNLVGTNIVITTSNQVSTVTASTTNTATTASRTATVTPISPPSTGTNILQGVTEFYFRETTKESVREFRNEFLTPQAELEQRSVVRADVEQPTGGGFNATNFTSASTVAFSLGDIQVDTTFGENPKWRPGARSLKFRFVEPGTGGTNRTQVTNVRVKWAPNKVRIGVKCKNLTVLTSQLINSSDNDGFRDDTSLTCSIQLGDQIDLDIPVLSRGDVRVDNYVAHTGRTFKLHYIRIEGEADR